MNIIRPLLALCLGSVILFSCGGDNTVNTPIQEKPSSLSLTSFQPSDGYAGDTITIAGKAFGDQQGSSLVRFNNIPALRYLLWSDTLLKVCVPSGAGTGKIGVVVGGKQVVSGDVFTVKVRTWYKISFVDAEQIYVMNEDGSNVKHLVTDNEPMTPGDIPQWSKDGAWIVYSKKCPGRDEMCISRIRPGGGGRQWLIDGFDPGWSPDGTKIVFNYIENVNRHWDTYICNADGGNSFMLTRGGYDIEWSPVDDIIAYSDKDVNWEIYTIRADGSGQKKLAPGISPHWSPDGTKIAYLSAGMVWVIEADGTGARSLAAGGRHSWSPDGTRLLFVEQGVMYSIGADGTGRQALGNGKEPRYSPDGTTILFGDENNMMYLMNSDGTNKRELRQGGSYQWSPVKLP